MEIVYFVDEFPPFFRGGLGTYAMEMTREIAKLGHNVTVFSRNVDKAPTRSIWHGIEIHRPIITDLTGVLPLLIPEDVRSWPREAQEFFAETFYYNLLSSAKLINVLVANENRKFDLVVSHDWLAAIGGIISADALKIPFVFHFHSTEQGRTGDGSPTIKKIESMAGNRADRIITVSYAMRDELVRLGHDEEKIRVVHNGIDPEKYDPSRIDEEEKRELRRELGIGDEEFMIFFIGRLTWVKGADMLVQAMPLILNEISNAKLVIIGKGEQEEMLRGMISNLGIGDRVILETKYITEEERILFYAASDVVVFPSKYEPFGIVCLEAMSMEKPVVVGAKGTSGFREQVIPYGEGRCGAHIDPDDPGDIAKFVIEILNDEDLRMKMGKNGRKRVLESFTLKKIAAQTIKVYEEVIK
ncbi:MAG: glycosyltransferase family 4 protein [Candidatus Syntropharchaeia archaeon]